MATETIPTPGSQSLADFQTVVQQNEGIFGPLQALASDGTNNSLTFEIGTTPAKRAILSTFDGASAPDKAGHTLICTGDCLVTGQPKKVAAYRPD